MQSVCKLQNGLTATSSPTDRLLNCSRFSPFDPFELTTPNYMCQFGLLLDSVSRYNYSSSSSRTFMYNSVQKVSMNSWQRRVEDLPFCPFPLLLPLLASFWGCPYLELAIMLAIPGLSHSIDPQHHSWQLNYGINLIQIALQ